MFTKFIECIVAQLVERKIIAAEEQAVYTFGIATMLIQGLHFLITVFIGYCMGLVWEMLLFLCAYIPLRVSAGGYHAPSNRLCFGLTVFLDSVVLIVLKYWALPWLLLFFVAASIVLAVFILHCAPVENEKKILDVVEKAIYARRTRWILSGIFVGMILALFYEIAWIAFVLTLSIIIESGMLWAGLRQNKKILRKVSTSTLNQCSVEI